MELDSAAVLCHLDKCPGVTVNVKTRVGRPNSAAGPGFADIAAFFPKTEKSPEFMLLAEVSAKAVVEPKDYQEQLQSGLNYCLDEAEKAPGRRIYCLVINGGEIHRDRALHTLYCNFLEANSLTVDSDIRFVPMFAANFGVLMGSLFFDQEPDKPYFDADVVVSLFEALSRRIRQPDLPEDLEWMVTMARDTINAGIAAAAELDDETKGPGGS